MDRDFIDLKAQRLRAIFIVRGGAYFQAEERDIIKMQVD